MEMYGREYALAASETHLYIKQNVMQKSHIFPTTIQAYPMLT